MSESDDRMIEILRILSEQEKATGSKLIADELKNKGFNLGERAVRYHMQILDKKGYTKRMGYAGRVITPLGLKKLEKGVIYDQVDFTHSKIDEMIYLTDFIYSERKGNVVVNKATLYSKESVNIMKKIFESGLSVSPFINIIEGKSEGTTEIKTICGTTIDGILLNEGIASQPTYGGLLEIEDYTPTTFKELISYKKTSITPLEAFIAPNTTSILEVIENGTGNIPANFRTIPSIGREKAIKIINDLKKIGIGGVIGISKEGEDMLGIPVPEGMAGIVITGGITPFCAMQELGQKIDITLAEELENFKNLSPITKNSKKILNSITKTPQQKISFLLSKSWNLIQQVTFDAEQQKGQIIANISYIESDKLDDAIEIMHETYLKNTKYINPFYKIVKHPTDEDKSGIATICSLTIDGILINHGIMSNPRYGGLLELTKPPLFIDLISYNGSTIDPHKIFITKNMTDIYNKNKILAAIKEIPYISRDYAVHLLTKLNNIGFSIYKIGKPRELLYNAKVDNYNFGIVAGSGLNTISAIKERGINIEVKAIEKLMPFEKMKKL